MVSGDEGALFGVPGFIDYVGEYFPIPAQGMVFTLAPGLIFTVMLFIPFFVASIRWV